MAWAEDQRQEWIAETLRVFGFINRHHVQRKFGISAPQVANDFARFCRERPGVMTYNAKAKRYEGAIMSTGVAKAMDKFRAALHANCGKRRVTE